MSSQETKQSLMETIAEARASASAYSDAIALHHEAIEKLRILKAKKDEEGQRAVWELHQINKT